MLGSAVAGCDSLSAQDRAMVNELHSYFDFDRYRSAEEAETALQERFPRFDQTHYASYENPEAAKTALAERAGEAIPLLAYLDKVATKAPGQRVPKKSHKKITWLHPRLSSEAPPRDVTEDAEARSALWKKNLIPADAYHYTILVRRSNDNNNFWAILLIVSEEGALLDSEIRLTYMDENFSTRGIPFRLVNARDAGTDWTRKILFDLLGDDITPARVEKLMMEGGADFKKVEERKGGITAHIYTFKEVKPRIWSMIYMQRRHVVISWRFDPNGQFQELYMSGDKT